MPSSRDSRLIIYGKLMAPRLLAILALSTAGCSTADPGERCEGPAARAFDFWIGDWEIQQRILQDDGTYLELPAKTSVSPALGGCALIEQWEGEVQFFWEGMQAPEPMQGLSVRAYDPERQQWRIHWMDSRTRHFDTPYVGNFADGRGEFYREWEAPEGSRDGRITFSDIATDSVHWSLAVSSDSQKSWTTIWTMAMRRRGRAP